MNNCNNFVLLHEYKIGQCHVILTNEGTDTSDIG